MVKEIQDGVYYIGVNNPSQKVFEGEIPLVDGMSYNSYLTVDKKTCLQDTVAIDVVDEFLLNLKTALNGRPLDYIVVHHMEPDHTAAMMKVLELYPEATVYMSSLAYMMFQNFFQSCLSKVKLVKEGDELDLGTHKLLFISAQMVHWPEVMMTYDKTTKTLYSADAFGAFCQVKDLYVDQYNIDSYLDESRRYYTNIVGKYGMQVTAVLNKLPKIEVKNICALHGPLFRTSDTIKLMVSKYTLWASYTEEKKGVLICYCTIYGHTQKAAEIFAEMLQKEGVEVSLVNLNKEDISYAVAKTFIYKEIVLFCPTFNNGLFPKMESYLSFIKARLIKNKRFTLIENGSWAPVAYKLMKGVIQTMDGNTISDKTLTIKSSLKASDIKKLEEIKEDFTNGKER